MSGYTGAHSYEVLETTPPEVMGRVPGRVRAPLTDAEGNPVPGVAARPSCTVVLLRDAADGVRVWMMSRAQTMVFAGAYVFPGGKLEPVDERAEDPLRACAVRELLEETGVTVDPAELVRWAHWITPESAPKRFDTHFYLAPWPEGIEPANLTAEADWANWAEPCAVLEAEQDPQQTPLMPPTRSVLIELCRLGSLERIFAAAEGRVIEPVTPFPVPDGDGWRMAFPSRQGDSAGGSPTGRGSR